MVYTLCYIPYLFLQQLESVRDLDSTRLQVDGPIIGRLYTVLECYIPPPKIPDVAVAAAA